MAGVEAGTSPIGLGTTGVARAGDSLRAENVKEGGSFAGTDFVPNRKEGFGAVGELLILSGQ